MTSIIVALLALQGAFSQTVTRGPYLQSLTPTSVKIKWRTNTASNSRVYYGTDPANLNLYEDVAASVTNHTVKLSNLQPYTTYYYSVGSATQVLSGPSALHRFKTAPLPGTAQPYRFWAIGDFGKNNQQQRDVLNSYLTYTGSTHTDLWLWLGDNAYDTGTDQEFQTKVFDVYSDVMKYMPFYPCPGNHDYGSVCPIPCFSNPSGHSGPYFDIIDVPVNGEAGGVPSGYELYYSFDYGNVHFISLNSELGSLLPSYDWNGTYSGSNFNSGPIKQWLINDLSANTKPWVIVFFHQPPHTDGSHQSNNPIELYMKAMRDNYCPIFEQYGVDIVLCGHSHVFERSYLLKGFFSGNFGDFNNSYKVNGTSGNFSLGEAYVKYINGPDANKGTVYVVTGNSGSGEPGASLNHPAMYYDDDDYGSFIIEVNGMRLDGKYLRRDGVRDEFTILKMPASVTSSISVTICSGQSYFAGGASQTVSGTYYDTLHGVSGSPDTIKTTHLTVTPPISVSRTVSICHGSSYFAGGAYQTASGTYTDLYTSAFGCDSTVVTHLSVLPQLQTSLSPSICEGQSYFAGGTMQSVSGFYYDTFTAAGGCDSIVTTRLTVNPLPAKPLVTRHGNTLSVPASYVSYQWYKNGMEVPGATLSAFLATDDGNYYAAVSDANGCITFSDTVTVLISGISPVAAIETQMLPNPITDDVLLIFSKIVSGSMHVEVFNVLGEKVMTENFPSFHDDNLKISMADLRSSIYLIKAWSGHVSFTGRVVKR